MARSITAALQQIKHELNTHVTPADIQAACRAVGHEWRERILGPVLTVQALLLQILHAIAMTAVSRLTGVAFTPSAYCQALKRLPVDVLRRLLRQAVTRQRRDSEAIARWRGHRVVFVDGSSCSMPDTPELQQRFGQPTEQKPGCGFPVAHLLALFDAYTGMLVDVLASSWRVHDLARVGELLPHLQPGDVLLGDRGFCSFAHIALLRGQGVHVVIRVHGRRHVSFRARQYHWAGCDWPQRLGINDQLTIWRKSGVPSRALPRAVYDALPERLIVRELRYVVRQPGYRTRRVTLVTTLVNAGDYPADALAELYQRRWQPEVNLRHLKDTLGMRVLRSQSAAGVERELLAFALVYNLICAVLTVLAPHLQTTPERISLLDVLRLLRYGVIRLVAAAIVVNPNRPGRVQPRVVKRRPLQYSRMTQPRAVLKRALMKPGSG
ncbi:MAG: IS4 family transposase [Phycisphaerae bacterium]|jgi:hypothetical protein|nr:IS4 family transposase [Phycisphaerae bacterium]HRS28683.1 IS4 family transposase [Phycisphaerae bacterium]